MPSTSTHRKIRSASFFATTLQGGTESPGSLLQYCHYFVYTQRLEDRVLHASVKKTKIIQEQLGILSQAIDSRLSKLLKDGITRADTGRLVDEIDAAGLDEKKA